MEQYQDFLIGNFPILLSSNPKALGDYAVFVGALVTSIPTTIVQSRSGFCVSFSNVKYLHPQETILMSM